MAKIKLDPNPTFDAPVLIPIAGGEPASVRFTFKHRTRDAVVAWLDEIKDKKDAAIVQDAASGWELDDAFTAENVERLCQNYGGAADAIFQTYLRELRGARVKN